MFLNSFSEDLRFLGARETAFCLIQLKPHAEGHLSRYALKFKLSCRVRSDGVGLNSLNIIELSSNLEML